MRFFDLAWGLGLALAMACGGEFSSAADADAAVTGASGSTSGQGGSTQSSAVSTGIAGAMSVGTGGTAGVGGSSTGTGGAGGAPNSGDCDSAADCGGDACVELIAGGYRVCAMKVPEATTCSAPPGQCCKTADCTGAPTPGGKCILGPIEPTCGGPIVVPTNVCASDDCTTAADCPGANTICAPAGTLGRKAARCLTGGCRFDRDCTAEVGGICVPVTSACCNEPLGLFCLYHDGCRSNADCQANEHCATMGPRSYCAQGLMPCPVVR
jgi:hypothetical protein